VIRDSQNIPPAKPNGPWFLFPVTFLDDPDRRDGVLDQEVTIHRAAPQLYGLVVDEQKRCVLRGEEMIGDRVADRGTGHWEQHLLGAGSDAPEARDHHGERPSPDPGDLCGGLSWRISITG
jgi:hypothetical protein